MNEQEIQNSPENQRILAAHKKSSIGKKFRVNRWNCEVVDVVWLHGSIHYVWQSGHDEWDGSDHAVQGYISAMLVKLH